MHVLLSIVEVWIEGLVYAKNSFCLFAGLLFNLRLCPITDHWMTNQLVLSTKLEG